MAVKATVVLPTYCEAENLRTLLPVLLEAAPVEVIVVDDNSPDKTADVAQAIAEKTKRVHVLRRAGKLGLGSAYKTGMRAALETGAEIVITMDADWSHDPARLPALLEAASDRALAIGSRYVPGGGLGPWPLSRRVLSRTAQFFARTMLGFAAHDLTSGYRAYHQHVLIAVPPESIQSDGYSFLIEMAYRVRRAGFEIREVPIIFTDRRMGQSKISRREIFRAMRTLFRLRF
ncbi:MAG: polyprenol monophosphomannose synthase [Candidatus Hydrogenedentota bacterium]